MTPLICEAVKMAPEPESAMWFDVGQMERWPGGQVPIDLVLNLPFNRVGFVGIDTAGKKFSLWLSQGIDSVAVAGASLTHKKYLEPFAYIKTDDGLKYYRKDRSISGDDVMPAFRMIAAILYRLSERKTEAYQGTPQRTFINAQRMRKGKSALTFDWHTVEVVPSKPKADLVGGTHASPRLHDRRGHWRNLKSGKQVWVKSCKVGDASKGVVFKDYHLARAAIAKAQGEL